MANGLAAQQQQAVSPEDQMVQEVVALLQQGASPEELVSMGVSVEAIEAAMLMIQQQAQAPVQDPGLAAKGLVNG